MPRNVRHFIPTKCYDVCFRVEDGLPLVPTVFLNTILEGILAAAASRYYVKISIYLMMANHAHMLVVALNQSAISNFVAYFKRESAHAINNLLGRRRHTVWESTYSASLILDAHKAMERIAYIYLNPARANLVDSIDQYPGLSSWNNLSTEPFILRAKRIPREKIPAIPEQGLTAAEEDRLTCELLDSTEEEYNLEIDTFGWMDYFPETVDADRNVAAETLRKIIYREQNQLSEQRSRPVIGAAKLCTQSMRKAHEPMKFGKKVLAMGSNPDDLRSALQWMEEQFAERRRLKTTLLFEDYLKQLPAGFFAPGGHYRASINPHFVPF